MWTRLSAEQCGGLGDRCCGLGCAFGCGLCCGRAATYSSTHTAHTYTHEPDNVCALWIAQAPTRLSAERPSGAGYLANVATGLAAGLTAGAAAGAAALRARLLLRACLYGLATSSSQPCLQMVRREVVKARQAFGWQPEKKEACPVESDSPRTRPPTALEPHPAARRPDARP